MRIAIGGLLVYLVNPIDLIPEFTPVLGARDDVVVAVLVLRYVRRRSGVEALLLRWRGTPQRFELLRPGASDASRRSCRRPARRATPDRAAAS